MNTRQISKFNRTRHTFWHSKSCKHFKQFFSNQVEPVYNLMLIQYTGLTASMSGALMPDLSFLKWLLSASEISRRSHRQLIRPHNSVTSFCMSSFCSSSWNSQQNTTYQVRNHSVDWIASLTIKYPQPLCK